MRCVWKGNEWRERRERRTNSLTQSQTLPLARNHHHDLPRLEHGPNTNGERHTGHRIDIVVEETGVGEDGVVG